jgi:hypothetical protein
MVTGRTINTTCSGVCALASHKSKTDCQTRLGAACTDDDLSACQPALATEDNPQMTKDLVWFEHAAFAGQTGSQMPLSWSNHGYTSSFELLQVFTSGWMIEHTAVHSRCYQHWEGARAVIVSKLSAFPWASFASVSAVHGNNQHVGRFSKRDMQDMGFIAHRSLSVYATPVTD